MNRDAGDLSLNATVQGMIAGIVLREGRYDDAIAVAEEAIAAAYLTNDRWRKGQVLITLGMASYYAGKRAKAAECMAEALALADELAEPGLRTLCLLGFVEWLGLLGEQSLAAEAVATVQTHFKLIDAWRVEVDVLCERFELVVDTAVAPDWPTLKKQLENRAATGFHEDFV